MSSVAPKKISNAELFAAAPLNSTIGAKCPRGYAAVSGVHQLSDLFDELPQLKRAPLIVLCGPYGARLDELVDVDAFTFSFSALWRMMTFSCVPDKTLYEYYYKVTTLMLQMAWLKVFHGERAVITMNDLDVPRVMKRIRNMPNIALEYSAAVVVATPEVLDESEYRSPSASWQQYTSSLRLTHPAIDQRCGAFIAMSDGGDTPFEGTSESDLDVIYKGLPKLKRRSQ